MTQTARTIRPVHSEEPLFPLSVEIYHDMIRRGILTDDDPVELIEGVLVFRMPKDPPHIYVVKSLDRAIERLLPAGWTYRREGSITLTDGEPEPDGLICRGTDRDYLKRHPGPAETTLIIEVPDSTLKRDRKAKRRTYARAGLTTYWIVNLNARLIEVYTKPQPDAPEPTYADRMDFGENDSVPVVLDGQTVGTIVVGDVLP